MVNLPENVHDESFTSNSLIQKVENSTFNKSNYEYLKTCISFFEKKGINYTVVALPWSSDERKISKRPKRVNNHNMYILFNSFYTKIRKPEWPNSPTMWDTVKAQKELADFVKLFDHTQKLGKSITNRSTSSSSTETISNKRRRSAVTNLAEVKENCDRRDKLYSEFYNVLNETFSKGVAPASSNIYDNVITRELVTRIMELFKSVALKLPSPAYVPTSADLKLPSPMNYAPTPVSKKRRAHPTAPKKIVFKHRRDSKPSPAYVDDNTQDTNMSE